MNKQPDGDDWIGMPQEQMPAVTRPRRPARVEPPSPPAYPPVYQEPEYAPLEEEGNFVHDLWRYFWILFRHRWVVGGVTVFFVCVGLLVTFISTPIYRASATIQIDREPAKVLNVQEVQTDVGSEAAFLRDAV